MYDEDYDYTDDKVFNHITSVDLVFVLVRDCNLYTDVCAPYDDNRRKRDNDINPKTVHERFKARYDLIQTTV